MKNIKTNFFIYRNLVIQTKKKKKNSSPLTNFHTRIICDVILSPLPLLVDQTSVESKCRHDADEYISSHVFSV